MNTMDYFWHPLDFIYLQNFFRRGFFQLREDIPRGRDYNLNSGDEMLINREDEIKEIAERAKKEKELKEQKNNERRKQYIQGKNNNKKSKKVFFKKNEVLVETMPKNEKKNAAEEDWRNMTAASSKKDQKEKHKPQIDAQIPTYKTAVKGNNEVKLENKRKKKASKKIRKFYEEITKKYDIKLVCQACLVIKRLHEEFKYYYNSEFEHNCKCDQLAIKPKNLKDCNDNWTLVRHVVRRFPNICEQFNTGKYCRENLRCPNPHTELERDLWNYFKAKSYAVDIFINDLTKTDLKLDIELRNLQEKNQCLFKFICKKCYKKTGNIVEKRRHINVCKDVACHKWDCNEKMVFVPNVGTNSVEEIHEPCLHSHAHCETVKKVKKLNFSHKCIAIKSAAIYQALKSEKKRKKKIVEKSEEEAFELIEEIDMKEVPLEEAYDNFDDIANNIGFPFDDLGDTFDDDMQKEYECEVAKSRESQRIYYEMFSLVELKNFLKNSESIYKRCKINLHGPSRAICDFLDVNTKNLKEHAKVEIRSRVNCGPCMDGDEVVVQLKNTKELGDDQVYVKRGTVVGILKHAFDRKEYTFLCRADSYLPHLMIPIDGVAPKIHVQREKLLKHKIHEKYASIYSYENDELTLVKSVLLDSEIIKNVLFVVKYIRWEFGSMYPLGYITSVIRSGKNLEDSQQVLNVTYQVPKSNEVTCHWETESDKGYEDLTHLYTLSIDPYNCRDVDDALSVVKKADSTFQVIVHIADVTQQVTKGCPCDVGALKRITSYYPAYGSVRTMLPSRLSENVCSLVEGEDRNVLSVYFNFKSSGELENSDPIIKKTKIQNKRKMTYKQVQDIIDGCEIDNRQLKDAIFWLYKISICLRKERMQLGWIFCQNNNDNPFEISECFEAHQLIEEFMILTNRTIAEFLYRIYPNVIPLRTQNSPDAEEEAKFFSQWNHFISGSAYFDRFINPYRDSSKDFIYLLKEKIASLEKHFEMRNFKKMKNIIGSEANHPSLSVALISWYIIQEKAIYVCSDEHDLSAKHFSLNLPNYVQFTSPIRRYIDIIVHRLVKAALNNESNPPYTKEEIELVCRKANQASANAKKYSKSSLFLKIAEILKEPIYLPIFIANYDEDQFTFTSPYLPKLSQKQKELPYKLLSLSDKPEVSRAVRLKWDKQIYSCDSTVFDKPHARDVLNVNNFVSINPEKHVKMIDSDGWKNLIRSTMGSDRNCFIDQWKNISQDLSRSHIIGQNEITSEMKDDGTMVRRHVPFSLLVKKGSVFAAQFGANCSGGYLQPMIKMINLTDENDLCLEHKMDPIKCFTTPAHLNTKDYYQSITQYQNIWRPLLLMEAVDSVVNEGNTIICHCLPVTLQFENERYYGSFVIGKKFCDKRGLNIENFAGEEYENNDFLCIRFPQNGEAETKNYNGLIRNKWVCHANTKQVVMKKGSIIHVDFVVHDFNCPPPQSLINTKTKCTIEFLTILLPEKKMLKALNGLDKTSEICQKIFLGESLEDHSNIEYILVNNYDIDHDDIDLYKNNKNQAEAIKRALSSAFTIIQGPPGTGKTVTAIKLAWWFARTNINFNVRKSENGQLGQILYCGPSNSSVDVATDWFLRLGPACPKIIRVYSECQERNIYHIPRFSGSVSSINRGFELKDKKEYKDIALHYLIRNPGNKYSEEIKNYDKKFENNLHTPENISDDELSKYHKLLQKASAEELKDYEIILCTCTASVNPRLINGSFVTQIIIDECGMCEEPECLLPLANYPNIKQVVLIGDHKQLQPIVKNRIAAEKGLQRSLFERYGEQSFMLNKQYRMHEAICRFPSRQFYQSRLITANRSIVYRQNFWPNPKMPIVFCHVEGAEKTLSVSTEEGNESSKSNELEMRETIRIFRELKRANVCILSQYKAHCNLISSELLKSGNENCKVSTVVSSQGNEWDYVILSLVRSMPKYEIEKNPSIGWCKKNLGFISDEHQINVALTRAKKGLIIIGNKNLLQCNPMWYNLLRDYDKHGCVIDALEFQPTWNRMYQAPLDQKFGRTK